MRSTFLDTPPPIAFAHRGFAPAGGENSMSAFAAAVALGYRYVETDVRVTADGVAVAFHDDVLHRVCDRPGVISALPWRVVSTARITGTEPIARLTDLLGEWPDLFVNIDVKSDLALDATLAAVRAAGAGHRVCLAAFSDRRVRRIRRALGPEVVTALGPAEVAALALRTRIAPGTAGRKSRRTPSSRIRRPLRGRCAQVPIGVGRLRLVNSAFLDAAHAAGAVVHVWTVNNPATMTQLLDLGADGIITDRADVLREILVTRGQWH
jgi:glycerophosphoryl diester phosphodiesterase